METFTNVSFNDGTTGEGIIIRRAGGKTAGLKETNEPRLDDSFPGCQYRMPSALCSVACNLKQTGEALIRHNGALWVRGQLEIVGDGEPSTFQKVLIRVG